MALGITVAMVVAARNGITFNDNGGFRAQQIGAGARTRTTPSPSTRATSALVNTAGNVQTVGGQLFTTFLLPFEITSLLLLVAAVGAVYLTRRARAQTQPSPARKRPLTRRAAPPLEEERIEVEVG